MDESEMIRIAKRAIDKGWSYEDLYYGDDMYGRESLTDDVYSYVSECKEIGTKAFCEKYKC